MATYNINLHEAIYSLSDALDLVGVSHIHHGKRVAFMAAECAKYLDWEGKRVDDLFQAAILHDSGVSKTMVHEKLAQFEWEKENDHCLEGELLLKTCPMLAPLAPIVRYHHTHWSDLKHMNLPDSVKWSANCIYMADRVDVLSLAYLVDQNNLLFGRESIRDKILEKRGDWFATELVDAFMEVSRSEAFWLSLESEQLSGYVSVWLSETVQQPMSFQELRSIVSIFSHIVDAKSAFTKEHSDGVARLARHLGNQFELSEESCEMLELAGLLHDIGKLRQPDALLDKTERLTAEEYSHIQRHSFDTYSILRNIKGLEMVALWAAQHHERADGSGYPYRLMNGDLSLEARIVAVADVFQALAQRRPYRESLPPEMIMEILNGMVASGKLDRDVVRKVDSEIQECWRVAVCK